MIATINRPMKRLERHKPHQIYKLKDGTRVPGASTIAKIGSDPAALIKWAWRLGMEGKDYAKVRDTAADIGSLAHFMIECHIENCEPDLRDYAQTDIDAAMIPFTTALDWWQHQGLHPVATELQLVSEKYRFGGTIDMPCRDASNGLVLLDWKTSKGIWPEHFYQLSGYQQLLEEKFSEPVIKRGIIRIGKDGSFEARWLQDTEKYFQVFQAQLALYNALKGVK